MPPAGEVSIHVWQRCHHCGAAPIVGVRYDCTTCPVGPDIHLCEACHAAFVRGAVAHPPPDTYAAALGLEDHRFRRCAGKPTTVVEPWRAVPDIVAATPSVPDRFVLRPLFCRGSHRCLGTYAFVVENGPTRLLLTALHVLDEFASGSISERHSRQDIARVLPSLIDHVIVYDVFTRDWMRAEVGTVGPMLMLPDARVGEDEPVSGGDIAAFVVDRSLPVASISLGTCAPHVGDPVWVTAKGQRTHMAAAVVVERSVNRLVFRYSDFTDFPRYSSGAPLIDRSGAAVGINVGIGRLDGRYYGHASPVESIRGHLGAALLASA